MRSSLYPEGEDKLTSESDPYLLAGVVKLRQPIFVSAYLVEYYEKDGYHVVTDSELGSGGEV